MTERSFADEIASTKIQGSIISSKGGFHVPADHKPPRISAAILQGMMMLFAIIMATATYMNYTAVDLVQRMQAGEFTTQEQYLAAAAPLLWWDGLVGPIIITAFVLSIIAYLSFVYFAARNLDRARATGFSHSPGGAVGVSFIPFANLVLIYRVMRDIWVSSNDPRRGAINGSVLLAPWWILYMVGNFGGNFVDRIVNDAIESGDFQMMTTILWVSIGLLIGVVISCILLFIIVGGIVRAQAGWRDLPAPPAADPATAHA